MKKIPTLFERIYEGHRIIGITENVTPGCEWVLAGDGIATEKLDGSCCAIINGVLYKRYDAKRGKMPPDNAVPCCDPDPVTGHWPHWAPIDLDAPADKWFARAYFNTPKNRDGTYEAVGPHFQGNPYGLSDDILEPHGEKVIAVPRTFDGIRDFLKQSNMEGIVFWKNGEPKCKIKRTDFGFQWPEKRVQVRATCNLCNRKE